MYILYMRIKGVESYLKNENHKLFITTNENILSRNTAKLKSVNDMTLSECKNLFKEKSANNTFATEPSFFINEAHPKMNTPFDMTYYQILNIFNPSNTLTKVCKTCGKLFNTSNSKTVYCNTMVGNHMCDAKYAHKLRKRQKRTVQHQ